MIVYKIECEWDMGFEELYHSSEAASKAIDEADWSAVLGDDDSLEDLIDDGYISIVEIEVK